MQIENLSQQYSIASNAQLGRNAENDFAWSLGCTRPLPITGPFLTIDWIAEMAARERAARGGRVGPIIGPRGEDDVQLAGAYLRRTWGDCE